MKIIFQMLLLSILVACTEESQTPQIDTQDKPEQVTDNQKKDNSKKVKNENDDKNSETPIKDEKTEDESEVIDEFSYEMMIYQAEGKNYYTLAHAKERLKENYAVHLDEIIIHFSLNLHHPEEFLSKIRLQQGNGNLQISKMDNNYYDYRISITDVNKNCTLSFGDELISFEKMAPLEWTLDKNELNNPVLLIVSDWRSGLGIAPTLYLSDKEQGNIILSFDEEMDTTTHIRDRYGNDENIQGEWVNAYQYSIDPKLLKDSDYVFLNRLKSLRGNSIFQGSQESLNVVREPIVTWVEHPSGEQVGWSQNDTYYDFLLFSPDNQSYIGVINHGIGPGSGDGDGAYYSFILERKGKTPVKIEQGFYTYVRHKGVPIQWMDNNRLMYASFNSVYYYNTNTGESKRVINFEDEDFSINQVVYDSFNNQTYMISHQYDPTRNIAVADKRIYENSTQTGHESNYSDTMKEAKYTINYLSIHPSEQGVFWTYKKNDYYYTHYEGRDGVTKDVKGEIISFQDEVIFLEVKQYGYDVSPPAYYSWKLEKQPIKIPDAPTGFVKPFGHLLVSVDREKDKYYYFDSDSNQWKSLELKEGHIRIPMDQEVKAIYQLKKK